MTVVHDIPQNLQLDTGGHSRFEEGACLLELAGWMAGEPWSDRPECVASVLATYGQRLNDALPDDLRQQLVPFAPRLIGTAGNPVLDERRGYMALDWLIRVYTPTWLRLVPALVPDADALAGLKPIDTLEAAAAVGDMVRDAATHSAAARAAAWDAAGDAAWAAAWAALAPTVAELQQSAIDLFDRLISVSA